VKLFEVVAGAHLVGTAPPGAQVQAKLDLHATASRHRFQYHRSVTADDSGHYDLVVAYPTTADSTSDVLAAGTYNLVVEGSEPKRVMVAPGDVVAGKTVTVK
jgi:hypothetical protein